MFQVDDRVSIPEENKYGTVAQYDTNGPAAFVLVRLDGDEPPLTRTYWYHDTEVIPCVAEAKASSPEATADPVLGPEEPMAVIEPAQLLPNTLPVEPAMAPEHTRLPLNSAPADYSFLPELSEVMAGKQSAQTLDSVLKQIPEIQGGPSVGGISWHTIESWKMCQRKAYFACVRAIRKTGGTSLNLDVGTLVHACFEVHYRSGGAKTFEPCNKAQEAGYTEAASIARRCVHACLKKYAEEEALTWDVRGLEVQATWHTPPRKITGEWVSIPLTCRHDMLVALREPGGPCAPFGPVPTGTYVCDHKTCSAMTYELTKGYGMDGQFLMNALLYQKTEVPLYGPLRGILVNLIAKHKNMDPNKSLERVYSGYEQEAIDEFEKEITEDAYGLYGKLTTCADDMYAWKKNHASCKLRGLCPYFDICDSPPGTEEHVISALYETEAHRKIDPAKFMPPPAELIKAAKEAAAAEAPAASKTRKTRVKSTETDALKDEVLRWHANVAGQIPHMQSGPVLLEFENKTFAMKAVAKMLADAYARDEIRWFSSSDFSFTPGKASVKWTHPQGKGSTSWSAIAKYIVEGWFNPATVSPEGDA